MIVALGCTLPASQSRNDSNTSQPNSDSNSDKSSVKKSGDDPTWKSATPEPGANPRDAVVNASKLFLDQSNFQAEADSTGSQATHMEVEYIAPDRYHIKTGPSVEVILIGRETYAKVKGVWRKVAMDLRGSMANMRESFGEQAMKTLTDVEFLGDDTVDGKDTSVRPRDYAEVNHALMRIVKPLRGGFDGVDVANQVGNCYIRRRELFPQSRLPVQPFDLNVVSMFLY